METQVQSEVGNTKRGQKLESRREHKKDVAAVSMALDTLYNLQALFYMNNKASGRDTVFDNIVIELKPDSNSEETVKKTISFSYSDFKRHQKYYLEENKKLHITQPKQKKQPSVKKPVTRLAGIHSPIFVGDAIQYWIANGDFGYFDPSDPSKGLLKDKLPLIVKEGLCTRNFLTNLFTCYANHNKLQIPDDKSFYLVDNVFMKAFGGNIESSLCPMQDTENPNEIKKYPVECLKLTNNRIFEENPECFQNVFSALAYNIQLKNGHEFNETKFNLGEFQAIISNSYMSYNNLRLCEEYASQVGVMSRYHDQYEKIRTVVDKQNVDDVLLKRFINEHNILEECKANWNLKKEREKPVQNTAQSTQQNTVVNNVPMQAPVQQASMQVPVSTAVPVVQEPIKKSASRVPRR